VASVRAKEAAELTTRGKKKKRNRLYFAFLTRPLQAWEYIGATAAKCMMLLSYPPNHDTPEDRERTRRIFWSCYILER